MKGDNNETQVERMKEMNMSKDYYRFSETDVTIEYNGDVYTAEVQGFKEKDDSGYRWYTTVTSMRIYNSDGERIRPNHPDYEDLAIEINSMNFEVEHEAEDFDDFSWSDFESVG